MSLKNVKNIVKGFTTAEPTDKGWYQKRMELCGGCKYNSKNMDPETMSQVVKLKLDSVCKGDSVCTACGCCVGKKARVEESTCGLIELGLEPKWGSLIAESPLDKSLVITCEDSSVTVDTDKRVVILKRKYTKDESKVTFKLKFKHSKKVRMLSAPTECSCTATNHKEISDKEFSLKVDVSTLNFKGEISERLMSVIYQTKPTKSQVVKLKIRLEKY